MAADHPIFRDVDRDDLKAVKRRVLADPAVVEERQSLYGKTPLMWAIVKNRRHSITHWLIEHRGQHNLEVIDCEGGTALHWACWRGPLSVVQALVQARADSALIFNLGRTPLINVSQAGKADIVAYLLQIPAVRASIHAVSNRSSQPSPLRPMRVTHPLCSSSWTQAPTPPSLLAKTHHCNERCADATRPSSTSSAAPSPSPTVPVPSTRPALSWTPPAPLIRSHRRTGEG